MLHRPWFVFVLLCFVTVSAHADLVDQRKAETNPFTARPSVRIIGSEKFDNARGMGQDVALGEALTAIIPSGYSLLAPGLESLMSRPVSWQGGKEWTAVLDYVIKQIPGLNADVDVTRKVVFLGVNASVAPPVQVSAPEPALNRASKTTATPAWTVREGEKVSTALSRWANIAGWKVVWDTDEVIAGADLSANGSFDDAVGTLVQAINAAGTPIKAKFHDGNKILQITEAR